MKPEDLLQEEIYMLVQENKKLILENDSLRDENESLWLMLEEVKRSDIKEHAELLKELELEIKLQSLMYTKKKGLA